MVIIFCILLVSLTRRLAVRQRPSQESWSIAGQLIITVFVYGLMAHGSLLDSSEPRLVMDHNTATDQLG